MCSRFKLLARIEQATVQEIIQYLYRLSRVYIVLAFISLINVAQIFYRKSRLVVALTIVYAALYLINVPLMTTISGIPTCTSAMVSNLILLLFNIAFMVFNVVVEKSLWALASLVGIFFQSTTIYIIYKLRVKLVNGEDVPLAEAQVEYGVRAPPIAYMA